MPVRKRRGKHGTTSRSTTPTPSEESAGDGTEVSNHNMYNNNTVLGDAPVTDVAAVTNISDRLEQEEPLILTSEKRQNIYECDYCHQDISQQPRIRCAVCTDFDLCLDCFATSDHQAMIARIKAASHTQNALNEDGIDSTNIMGVAISSAAANHDSSHGYKVCDSTRYPVFASGRVVPKATSTAGPVSVKSAASSVSKGTDDDANEKDSDDMDVERPDEDDKAESETADSAYAASNFDAVSVVSEVALSEDPKFVWTAEEDLRLIDAIKTHGLGNWIDISEAISGNGSLGKTPKRCMERYFDDFLGRYGHILPPWTAVDDDLEGNTGDTEPASKDAPTAAVEGNQSVPGDNDPGDATPAEPAPSTPVKNNVDEEEAVRSSKRQRASMGRLPASLLATTSLMGRSKKKLKVVPTDSVPKYDNVWPDPYIPPTGVEMGQEVARDIAYRAELAFVKATMAAPSKEEADRIRQDWIDNRMGQIGSPTVLPPRPEDSIHLPGSELAGYMPRRGDFDVEWGNDAEQALADMEFTRDDTPQEKQLKLQVLEIYCQKLDEREKRKNFILSRHLYDYRKYVQDDQKLPKDERDLVHRMRMFERFHTPEEHERFLADILKAKRLRKEIAKLQMYRRIGIRSLAEAEKYELDKNRRQFHKIAQMQREADAKLNARLGTSTASEGGGRIDSSANAVSSSVLQNQRVAPESLWKQYRTNDRKQRRSSHRNESASEESTKMDDVVDPKKLDETNEASEKGKHTQEMKAVSEDQTEERNEAADNQANVEDATKEEKNEFHIVGARGYDLLSKKERKLCEELKLYPVQYLEIKKVLIHEALVNGMLDESSSRQGRRTIVKIDVERRGNVVDFLVRAGWISKDLGDIAKRVVTPPPVTPPPAEKPQTEALQAQTQQSTPTNEVMKE
jgi:hypothetical protein